MTEGTPRNINFAPRRVAAALTAGLTLAACGDKQPEFTDSFAYKKVHVERYWAINIPRKLPYSHTERDIETISSKPIHIVRGSTLEKIKEEGRVRHSEHWIVSVAQCPTQEPRPVEKIEKECKTSTVYIPQDIFNGVKIGQAFTKPK